MVTLLVFSNQIMAQNTAQIEVVKFNWSIYNPPKERNPAEELNTGSFKRPDRDTPSVEKSMEERSRDLARTERAAVRQAAAAPENMFLYELKIKNLDTKNIKSFIWEYQASKVIAPQDISVRRFLCVGKVKAGDSKTLKIFSLLPPVNVVYASASKDKSGRNYALDIIINRVEYSDGTIWQKSDWDNSKVAIDSPQVTERLKNSPCAVI